MTRGRKPKLNAGQIMGAYYETGSVTKACKKLKIERKTFYNTMKRLGLTFKKQTRIIENKA